MTPSTERRAIAFIRTIANRCERCLHRSEERCRGCVSQWANEIMADYERESGAASASVDYSLAARRIRILDAIQTAGRPLLAAEIDLSDVCSTQLKEWTLLRMIRVGQLARVPNDDPEDRRRLYKYFIPDNTTPRRSKKK